MPGDFLTDAQAQAYGHFVGRQAYREGQEDQLGALGLVLNAIVVWNTRYMGLALDELQKMGMPINPEDVERLSPLLHHHIHLDGRYTFALPEAMAACQVGEVHPVLPRTARA